MHDLKNPFNFILGFTDILNDDDDDYSEAERRDMIGKLNRSVENAFKLLDNLLNWCRIQTNRLEQKSAKLRLSEVIQSTFDLISVSAEHKGFSLKTDVPESLFVFVDRIFWNPSFEICLQMPSSLLTRAGILS